MTCTNTNIHQLATNQQIFYETVKISLGYTPSPCEFEIYVSLSDMPNYSQIYVKFVQISIDSIINRHNIPPSKSATLLLIGENSIQPSPTICE